MSRVFLFADVANFEQEQRFVEILNHMGQLPNHTFDGLWYNPAHNQLTKQRVRNTFSEQLKQQYAQSNDILEIKIIINCHGSEPTGNTALSSFDPTYFWGELKQLVLGKTVTIKIICAQCYGGEFAKELARIIRADTSRSCQYQVYGLSYNETWSKKPTSEEKVEDEAMHLDLNNFNPQFDSGLIN